MAAARFTTGTDMTHHGDIAAARTVPLGTGAPTLPDLLAAQARTRGGALALLHKRLGIWQTWTWRQAAAEVARLAGAIVAHGVRPGEAVLVAGASRPRLLLAMLACQHAGAVPVLVPQEGAGVGIDVALADHQPRLAFVAGEHEVYPIAAVRERLVRQPTVVCDDARGLTSLRAPWLVTLEAFAGGSPGEVASLAAAEDAAAIVYVEAIAGPARATRLTHAALAARATQALGSYQLGTGDRGFMAVPLGWSEALLHGPVLSLHAGYPLAFPESDATVLRDLREAGPALLFGPPALFRQLRQAAFLATKGSAWPWRGLLERAFSFAAGDGRAGLLARGVVGPARDLLGVSRLRLAICFGGLLPPQIAAFLTLIGARVATIDSAGGAFDAVAARLSGSVYIRHAYVACDDRGDLVALLALDPDSVAQWAQSVGERVRSTAELAGLAPVRALLAGEIAALNATAAPGQRIAGFLIAPNGFDTRQDEITADGRLRRESIERLHAAALAALRDGRATLAEEPAAPRSPARPARAGALASAAAENAGA